jgi:hypothetical protein
LTSLSEGCIGGRSMAASEAPAGASQLASMRLSFPEEKTRRCGRILSSPASLHSLDRCYTFPLRGGAPWGQANAKGC